jgi:hypothetical protein
MFRSFRHSVGGLLDTKGTSDDVIGLLWLAAIGVVVVVFLSLMRAIDKRRPMR